MKNETESTNMDYLSKLFVYFPSYSIDTKSLETPLKMNIQTEIYEFQQKIKQKSEISLSVLNFTDFNSLYDESNMILIKGSSTILSKLSFENEKRTIYPTSSNNNEILNIKIGLSIRSTYYTRKVLRYDDFLGNIVGYLSNIILILYIFNVIYNAFGSRVYFADKFFIRQSELQCQIAAELQKKIGKK